MLLDSYDTPDAQELLARERQLSVRLRRHKELLTNVVWALGFLTAASLLAAVAPWPSSVALGPLLLVLVTYALAERVTFSVAGGFTHPTMLAFIPMLFLLPTPVVPLITAGMILLGQVPSFFRDRARAALSPTFVADAWYTLGPALVIVLGHAQHFAWSHWPVYLAALAAQILFDMASTMGRCWFGERIKPCVQMPLLMWVYALDATLAPLGLLIAASAVNRPGLILLTLPLMGVFFLFARERQERLDRTVALNTAYRGTALLLGDIVEADDHYTGIHSRDVVDLSLAVANELELDSNRRRDVEFAALLHDVGKVRVPKEIINKSGALDEHEWQIMREHTIIGEQMLMQVGGALAGVGRIVRSCHERHDGTGYPDGLSGETIPIEARIVSACDAYSAMTTNRPYRAALTVRDAMNELQRCAGTQFDPAVVEALTSALSARPVRRPIPDPELEPDPTPAVACLV